MKKLSTRTYTSELEVYTAEEAAKEPRSKFFRMSEVVHFTEIVKQKEEDLIQTLFYQIAILSHYDYFKKKLWKKVKGFKKKDEAEVIIAFASALLRNKGIYTQPCGCAWCSFDWKQEDLEDYFKEYQPVFEDYGKWCMAQR
jgi:hypothetical protein